MSRGWDVFDVVLGALLVVNIGAAFLAALGLARPFDPVSVVIMATWVAARYLTRYSIPALRRLLPGRAEGGEVPK